MYKSLADGMFDIAGTMWMVYLLYVYGLKSIWLPWLWPVFNQVFLAAYLSQWLRRSGVMTGAEWITFRFGSTVAVRRHDVCPHMQMQLKAPMHQRNFSKFHDLNRKSPVFTITRSAVEKVFIQPFV